MAVVLEVVATSLFGESPGTVKTLPAALPIAGSSGIGSTTAPGRKKAESQTVPAAATSTSAVRERWAERRFISTWLGRRPPFASVSFADQT